MAAPLTRPIKEGQQTDRVSAKRQQVCVSSGEMLNVAANCTFVDSLVIFFFHSSNDTWTFYLKVQSALA